jgi:hypothetical protein
MMLQAQPKRDRKLPRAWEDWSNIPEDF